ncbi:50S ribosomal protein L27 [Candidatus Roizmanbacteria bacterium]|nr:50S ribosomal protein L27 [Candidatus Roizmanbacteria bacterium]
MAHTKAQKAVKGNRDSQAKRLGVKVWGGQKVVSGNIILRQRGSKVYAGEGALLTKDYTVMALRDGVVKFVTKKGRQYIFVV